MLRREPALGPTKGDNDARPDHRGEMMRFLAFKALARGSLRHQYPDEAQAILDVIKGMARRLDEVAKDLQARQPGDDA